MNKTVSNFLVGFLAGAAVGAIAGILLAPDKGSKTRQNLGKKVKDLSDEFGLGIGDLIDELQTEPEPKKRKAHSRKPQAANPKP
jgi:gas vesicle protein